MGSGSDEVEEIRRDIERSRENLGQAVGGLAYKADVKNRSRELVDEKKEAVMDKLDELRSKAPAGDETEGGFGDKVKSRLPSRDEVGGKVESARSQMPDGVADAAGRIGERTPSREDVEDRAHGAAETARQHPAAVAGGAAVAGLAAGLALPETDLERERLKPRAQDARAEVEGRVRDTVQQVKSGVQDAAGSVTDAVRQQADQQDGKVGEMAEEAAGKTDEKLGNA